MIRQIPDVLAAIEKNSKVLESITEGTYNSKNHIGSTSDGQGSNAEIYKKGKGYYVVVSGEADYDFDAKNDKELLKLHKNYCCIELQMQLQKLKSYKSTKLSKYSK
jgi:hypothetical protein